MKPEDVLLLRQFAQDGDENAFKELVELHLSLVFSTALRQLGGDTHLAQDVSQQVFLALARSAPRIARKEVLTAWLYRTTRNLAANAVRAETRRRLREQAATNESMQISEQTDLDESNWQCVSRHLDEAMSTLSAGEHTAILLRFFRQLDFRAVGLELGVTDDTAQKRVSRALDRLRHALCERGVTLSVAALGPLIAGNAVTTAPSGLAATILAGIKATAGSTAVALGGFSLWEWSRPWRAKMMGGAATVLVLSLFLALRPGSRQVENAVFELASDFPPPPGGESPWSPGWTATLGGRMTPLRHVKRVQSVNRQLLMAWQVDNLGRPTLAKNLGTETAISGGGSFMAPPGAVYLTAEVGETPRRFGVVRFTTPPGHSASYRLSAAVQPVFLGASSGDTDFHILKNGAELFGRFLGPETGASYSNLIQLKAGDTVDFVVGQGRNPNDEGAALRIHAVLAMESAGAAKQLDKALTLAPMILAPPSDQGVLRGEKAEFDALATGTPPLHYQWWFGEKPVTEGTNSSLHIPSAATEHVGQYYLVVTNAAGAITSAPARLALVTCVPAPSSLAVWWPGEQNAMDRSGGQHGSAMAGVTFVPGLVGQAFRFAGPDAGIHVPAAKALDVGAGDGFTIEMWVKPDRTDKKIPLLGWNSTNSPGANLSIVSGLLYANLRDADGTPHPAWSDADVGFMPGKWKHIAVTFDSPSQTLRLYVNGHKPADVPTDSFRANTTFDLQIGRRTEGDTVLTYSGLMDEIGIYSRALTPDEIAAIVQAGNAGKCAETVTASAQPLKE